MPPTFGQFEQKDPAQMAQEETDRLNELVGLTDKQYKKIYKFNKRQYEQLKNQVENAMPQGFPGGQGMGGGMQELMQEQQEKREKKYRKVLTPEQYQKWESFEAEREFRRMVRE